MPATTPPAKHGQAWLALRRKAQRLFAAGDRQSSIARKLGVSRQCVHNWYRHWRGVAAGGGTPAARGGVGRRSKLSDEQLAAVDAGLRRGPQSFGFPGARWTLWRVAEAVERITGVRYHPSSVWRILRALGWTLRLPPRAQRKKGAYIPREWEAPARSVFAGD